MFYDANYEIFHFSGDVIKISAFNNNSKFGVKSLVNSNTFLFKNWNLFFQSVTLSFANDLNEAIYIIFPIGFFLNKRYIANSAITVLPFGAPTNKYSSVRYTL